MYSVILLASLTAPAEVPAGIFFDRPPLGARAGCTGATATVRVRVREARPVQALAARQPLRIALRSAGCAGASFAARERFVFRARAHSSSHGCAGATFAPKPALGCSGGTVTLLGAAPLHPAVLMPGTAPPPAAAPAPEPLTAGPLQRIRVHRALNKALRQGDMTPEQASDVVKVLRNPRAYDKLVDHVHAELHRSMAGTRTSPAMQAIGDGHIIDMILSRLPAILEAIKSILAMFSLAAPVPTSAPWLPMPPGPASCPALAPPAWLAC